MSSGNPGNNSVFSTITSAGGGGGGGEHGSSDNAGNNGGSGGGAGRSVHLSGGAGNTPPVSPPQGNHGGGQRHLMEPNVEVVEVVQVQLGTISGALVVDQVEWCSNYTFLDHQLLMLVVEEVVVDICRWFISRYGWWNWWWRKWSCW
jgi:hypothetical protein